MAPKPAPRPVEGVEFPKDAEGKRPTMSVNKGAFAAALKAVSAEESKKIEELPERKWRKAYQKHVVDQVRHSAQSEEAALAVASAGLDYLHDTMTFVRPAGAEDAAISLTEAMAKYTDKKFQTYEIQGNAPRVTTFSVQHKPYGAPGPLKELKGDALRLQIESWVKSGAIEMSCGEAMTKVVDNPEWYDLSDTYFVLFGATSAMGPFYKLMDLGANVIAIDLDRPQIWERLIKDTRGRAGKLIFPVKEAIPEGASDADIAKVAGCNLLTDTPEIRTWVQDLYPEKKIVCMALAYLDGPLFVKVSMAMDAIIKSLVETRSPDSMGVAYLCTPTDAHLCTASSVEASKSNFRKAPAWQNLLAPVLGMAGMPMKKNVERPIKSSTGEALDGVHVVDCIIPEQGPNYILAKRLQHWRAMLSRKAGCLASSNVAPSTATASVLSNVLFAMGYKGMSNFRPMEITYPETSNSVMTALLIRDVRDPTSAANPKTPLTNPLNLFTDGAFHGGCWRSAWKFGGMGAPALLGYMFAAFVVAPYLLFYSIYQSIGWATALLAIAGHGSAPGVWGVVGPMLTFFQHLGLMEVVHAGLGMTRSSPAMTFLQIFSRILVVAFLNECPTAFKDDAVIVPMMLTAWCIADFTRYLYYAIGQLRDIAVSVRGLLVAMKKVKMESLEKADDPMFGIPFPLVWLRYSMFIVLYPTGVFGEMSCIWMAIGEFMRYIAPTDSVSISSWTLQNIQVLVKALGLFNESAVLFIIYLSYFFGLPALFLMLLASRKKQLAPAPKAKKDSTQKKIQ